MTPGKVIEWVEFYGNASAFVALSHAGKDREAADNFAANADLALRKVRQGIAALAERAT